MQYLTILNCIKLPVLRAFFGGPIGLKKIQNATFTPRVGAEIGPAPQHFFNCISFNLDLKKRRRRREENKNFKLKKVQKPL